MALTLLEGIRSWEAKRNLQFLHATSYIISIILINLSSDAQDDTLDEKFKNKYRCLSSITVDEFEEPHVLIA